MCHICHCPQTLKQVPPLACKLPLYYLTHSFIHSCHTSTITIISLDSLHGAGRRPSYVLVVGYVDRFASLWMMIHCWLVSMWTLDGSKVLFTNNLHGNRTETSRMLGENVGIQWRNVTDAGVSVEYPECCIQVLPENNIKSRTLIWLGNNFLEDRWHLPQNHIKKNHILISIPLIKYKYLTI